MRTLFFFFGHSKDIIVKIMLLPKPVDKILLPYNISDLFRRRLQMAIFPVQLASIQLPCFPTKIFNNAPVNASLIFWFFSLEKICPVTWTLPWEITKYLIDRQTFWSNRNDPYAGIRTTQKGRLSPCRWPVSHRWFSCNLGRHKKMVKWTNTGGQKKWANERSFVYRPPAWQRWRNLKTTYCSHPPQSPRGFPALAHLFITLRT